MARKIAVLAALAVCTAMSWGQSSPTRTPRSGAQASTSAGAAKSAAPSDMHPMHGMGMSHEDMQQMRASLNRMHALLNSMRANLASMDPKSQPAMLSNIEMWQLMLDHMDSMMKHMEGSH